jgi:hypothetical protein
LVFAFKVLRSVQNSDSLVVGGFGLSRRGVSKKNPSAWPGFLSARKADLKKGLKHLVLVLNALVLVVVLWTRATSGSSGCSG